MCASAELLAATRWAGVRKDIDVRIGSAEDHWPVAADVCVQIGQSKENKNEQSVSIAMTNKKCGIFSVAWNRWCYPISWKLDHCVAHSLSVLPMPPPSASKKKKKARTSRGRTGYPSARGGPSNGLNGYARTFVTHQGVSLACDLPSPSTPGSGLLQTTVTPMSGNLRQVPRSNRAVVARRCSVAV